MNNIKHVDVLDIDCNIKLLLVRIVYYSMPPTFDQFMVSDDAIHDQSRLITTD